jgi:hypothetical protein
VRVHLSHYGVNLTVASCAWCCVMPSFSTQMEEEGFWSHAVACTRRARKALREGDYAGAFHPKHIIVDIAAGPDMSAPFKLRARTVVLLALEKETGDNTLREMDAATAKRFLKRLKNYCKGELQAQRDRSNPQPGSRQVHYSAYTSHQVD